MNKKLIHLCAQTKRNRETDRQTERERQKERGQQRERATERERATQRQRLCFVGAPVPSSRGGSSSKLLPYMECAGVGVKVCVGWKICPVYGCWG